MAVAPRQEEEAQEPIRVEEGEQGAITPTTHPTPATHQLHLPPSPLARRPPCTRGANLPEHPQGATRPPLLLQDREAMANMDKATARAKRTSARPLEERRGDTLTTALPTPARSLEELEDRTTVMRVS